MLTPLEPNAGPTGGAGVAFPASSASLITPVTVQAHKGAHYIKICTVNMV